MHATTERLLTVHDVADRFQTSDERVQMLARSGELPGLKIGGRWRFRASTVEAWTAAREARLQRQLGEDEL